MVSFAAERFDDYVVRRLNIRTCRPRSSTGDDHRHAVIFPRHLRNTGLRPRFLMGHERIGQHMRALACQPRVWKSVVFVFGVEQINDWCAPIQLAPSQATIEDCDSSTPGEAVIDPSHG